MSQDYRLCREVLILITLFLDWMTLYPTEAMTQAISLSNNSPSTTFGRTKSPIPPSLLPEG